MKRLSRVLLLVSVVAQWTACVWPGEFDEVQAECDESTGAFDVPTRDRFCSGRVDTRLVHRFDSLDFVPGARPMVDIQGEFITWMDVPPQGGAAMVYFLRSPDGLSYELLDARPLELPFDGPTTSFVVMGLEPDQRDLGDATLSVSSSTDLYFLPLSLRSPGVPVGELVPPVDYLTDDAREEFEQMQASLPEVDRCYANRGTGERYRLSAVSAFDSQTVARRRYLMVAAGCAMSVFGYDPALSEGGEPQLMVQYPIQARGIDIDRAQDRFYLASGTDGLLVRTLSRLEGELDEMLSVSLAAPGCVEGDDCESSNDANNGGANNAGGDPDRTEEGAFTPDIGDVGDDVVALAATHVEHVSFARDRRIFYINTPRPEDIPARPDPSDANDDNLKSYLVSVTLDPNGVVEERFSVPLASPDPDTGEVPRIAWDLVGFQDSLVAVLANFLDEDGGVERSVVVVYDAPRGKAPADIRRLPLASKVYDLSLQDGQLWATQSDGIVSFLIEVKGQPLP